MLKAIEEEQQDSSV